MTHFPGDTGETRYIRWWALIRYTVYDGETAARAETRVQFWRRTFCLRPSRRLHVRISVCYVVLFSCAFSVFCLLFLLGWTFSSQKITFRKTQPHYHLPILSFCERKGALEKVKPNTVVFLFRQTRIQGVGAGAGAHPWDGVSPFKIQYSITFKHQCHWAPSLGRNPVPIRPGQLSTYYWARSYNILRDFPYTYIRLNSCFIPPCTIRGRPWGLEPVFKVSAWHWLTVWLTADWLIVSTVGNIATITARIAETVRCRWSIR